MNLQSSSEQYIEIFGAREHNLKNLDLRFPRNQLIVITGVSGSGKSSLAFDTIYAEGQRRYMESFSAYARSFIGSLERPEVDKINGLSPVIAIEQKTTSRNPRSTVGTSTEIYDFLRLLYARAGIAYSYISGEMMVRQSEDQMIENILSQYEGKKINLLAPVVRGRKGHYRELFAQIRKKGFSKVRVNGTIEDLRPKMQVDRYKTHDIEIVIDRIVPNEENRYRLSQSVQTALKEGEGMMFVLEADKSKADFFSKDLVCPSSGISYDEPSPNSFSFNSPYGACPSCNGLGELENITEESIIEDPKLSISQGAIGPIGEYRDTWIFRQLEVLLKRENVGISKPWEQMSEEVRHIVLWGSDDPITVFSPYYNRNYELRFEGILPYLRKERNEAGDKMRERIKQYSEVQICPSCEGGRLRKQSLFFRIDDKNIAELAEMNLNTLAEWLENIESRLNERQNVIAEPILKELRKRLELLNNIGLSYLTLNRPLRTLSGGEAQRIRLATQIGTQLVGVLYILDEPSIGLHARDNLRLIESLKALRDLGNSVIVVEHDKEMMLEADYIVDIGPGAGAHGGRVVAEGSPQEILKSQTETAAYLSFTKDMEMPEKRRKGNGKNLILKEASGHNLKNVNFKLPLGTLTCVTGVSGSGKSSLIHETLFPILNRHFYRAKKRPLPYKSISGLQHLDKVIEIDQSPIGRSPRSNPATYVGFFTDIRALFTQLPEAKIRGYKPGRFSFNVKGGRCEDCQGAGLKLIEMDFLPDVYVECETCKGKRYNRETLEVRFKSKSIADVLDMTVEQAVEFFDNQPRILRKVNALQAVGLGYIKLGQQATTLSGGEAQRVKLASELSRRATGSTLYILDEPTTGLHFEDIRLLLNVLQKLVDKGNTVLIIEHNLDVIKVADHIIDLGKEGGEAGGEIIFEGTPEKLVKQKNSYTGQYLKNELELSRKHSNNK